ncbi:hypothetical protein ACFSC4_17100 [Deinococcus malanensis]|uniref:hypothetical protein n=1 Tax=Deinococcus malanensis TaxID=1706855 RepID=UPI003633D4FD
MAQILRRRLPGTWLTLIGPHLDDHGLQVHPQRGALRGLVTEAYAEDLRVNLLLPSRASSGDELLDAPVGQTVLSLALPVMNHLRGNVIEVPLPPAPKLRVTDPQLL